jgi:hypothetical protein
VVKKFSLLPVCLLFLSGCMSNLRFYPVEGTLAEKTPPLVLVAKMTGLNSGNMSLKLADGEVCKGRWAQVKLPDTRDSGTSKVPSSPEMAAIWDKIYGQGFYVSNVLGTRHFAQATMKGLKGTQVDLEMTAREGPGANDPLHDIKGVAKDSRGNVYKVVM